MSTSNSKAAGGVERPLSPHLQIYRMSWTMFTSGLHRVTGLALSIGTLVLAYWLISTALGKGAYEWNQWLFGSWIGRLALLGFTWSLFQHLVSGVRFLIWDFGRGFGEHERFLMAKMTFFVSIPLTLLAWIVGYAVK